MFPVEDLLPLLVLALGAAMVMGHVAALVHPPEVKHKESDLAQAPRSRTLLMIGVGALASLWALASLLSG